MNANPTLDTSTTIMHPGMEGGTMGFWLVIAFTALTAANLVLSEYWHSKRPVRLRVRPDDTARVVACLNAAPTEGEPHGHPA